MTKLQCHIGHKPECYAFIVSLRHKLPTTTNNNNKNVVLTHQPEQPTTMDTDVTDTEEMDTVQFPNDDFDSEALRNVVTPSDFEQMNFDTLHDSNQEDGYLLNPDPAIFSNTRRVEVILLKFLTELEAPLWAFKTIMDWACDASQSGYKFMPRQQTYNSQISIIEKWVGMENMRPTEVVVALPGKRTDDHISVTTFDFISQFHSLLSDPELNVLGNLVINPTDPFTKYQSPDGRLGESLSGTWYKRAWRHMTRKTTCDFMIPIILYIDKTQMSLSGKLSLFPVMMSLAIFTEEARRKSFAWRPLGYIANEDYYFSAAERDENSPDVKNHRFHVQLHEILKSFETAQAPGALEGIKLQLGGTSQIVNLYVPLQYIIGDVEGGDQLCSRYSYRGAACQRLCRTCNVSTENAGRTDLFCKRVRVADIRRIVALQDEAELKRLAQRPFYNSLYNIDCGNDPYGVFSMIHTEGLHAIEVGLIPYMLEILFQGIPKTRLRDLDKLVKRLVKHPRQHGYHPFPRLIWQDGVTTITQLTGDLKVGKMFAISVVASTLEGEQFFTEVLEGGEATWKKMLYVFQQILCYWTWLKQDTFWLASDTTARDNASTSIRVMMQQLQALWPRKAGLEWNLTKLHEQFHVPEDIHRNGRHKNVHTGPQEHNHITLKYAARRTQLNRRTLDIQTGERLIDRLVIQRAYDRVMASSKPKPPPEEPPDPFHNASKGNICINSAPNMPTGNVTSLFCWKQEKQGEGLPLHENQIRGFVAQTLFTDYSSPTSVGGRTLTIPFFTEYERNKFVYRAHPKYRGGAAYYDWAKIKWEVSKDPVTGVVVEQSFIGRVLCFIQHPDGKPRVIVHSCMSGTDEPHGVFGTYWHLEYDGPASAPRPKLHMVSVHSLQEHACMIPYSENDPFTWVHIWNPDQWPGCFQTIQPPNDNNLVHHQ